MTNVDVVDSLKYGLKLFGYFLGVVIIGGGGMALGLALAAPEIQSMSWDLSGEYDSTALAGGLVLTLLGTVVWFSGNFGLAYKLFADSVTEGMSNAGTGMHGVVQEQQVEEHQPEPERRTAPTGPSPGEQTARQHGPERTVPSAQEEPPSEEPATYQPQHEQPPGGQPQREPPAGSDQVTETRPPTGESTDRPVTQPEQAAGHADDEPPEQPVADQAGQRGGHQDEEEEPPEDVKEIFEKPKDDRSTEEVSGSSETDTQTTGEESQPVEEPRDRTEDVMGSAGDQTTPQSDEPAMTEESETQRGTGGGEPESVESETTDEWDGEWESPSDTETTSAQSPPQDESQEREESEDDRPEEAPERTAEEIAFGNESESDTEESGIPSYEEIGDEETETDTVEFEAGEDENTADEPGAIGDTDGTPLTESDETTETERDETTDSDDTDDDDSSDPLSDPFGNE